MLYELYILENGKCNRKSGYRQVAFSPDGTIIPILFKAKGLHTTQLVKSGDYVVRMEWQKDQELLLFYKRVGEEFVEIKNLPFEIPQSILNWMRDGKGKRQVSYLNI